MHGLGVIWVSWGWEVPIIKYYSYARWLSIFGHNPTYTTCHIPTCHVWLQPYDHLQHIKYIKHLQYAWNGCDMSFTGVGGANHKILQLCQVIVPLWSQTHLHNLSHSNLSCLATTIWTLTTYKVYQTPLICMDWVWYEFHRGGRRQS
jgi:hypothetical protein